MHDDLRQFLPYLLNQAAETASIEFQAYYRSGYGMLRAEWRVLFHLGLYGELTAKRICALASLHKTKVSRAVGALEAKRFVRRVPDPADRRSERLCLTARGRAAFEDLRREAGAFEARLLEGWSAAEVAALRAGLARLSSTGSATAQDARGIPAAMRSSSDSNSATSSAKDFNRAP